MASPAVEQISRMTNVAWPHVQKALHDTVRRIGEISGLSAEVDKEVEIYFARAQNGRAKRKHIVNETVWILQKKGLLRSEQDARIIQLVRRVVEDLKDELPDAGERTAEENELIELVDELPTWKEEV